VAPDDGEVSLAAAVALERIYQALNDPRGLVGALKLRAKFETDAETRRDLYSRAGELQEFELRDNDASIESQRARLEIDPSDRKALAALARLYDRTEKWAELVATLRAD